MPHKIRITFFALTVFCLLQCTKDSVEEPDACMTSPTYNTDTRALIQNKCAFSGCHDGASGVGNYTTYQGIQRNLENGAFQDEVLDARTMPQVGTLSTEEYELFRCWAENGYPEN